MKHLNFAFLMAGLILTSGCQDVRSKLGLEHESPDEYAVTPSHQPLEMPPDFFNLPSPQSESSKIKENQTSIISYTSATTTPISSDISAGQKEILEKTGATQNEKGLRQQLDDEANLENVRGQGLLERFNIVEKKPLKGDLLNPHEEADQLKKKGLPDPRDNQSAQDKKS